MVNKFIKAFSGTETPKLGPPPRCGHDTLLKARFPPFSDFRKVCLLAIWSTRNLRAWPKAARPLSGLTERKLRSRYEAVRKAGMDATMRSVGQAVAGAPEAAPVLIRQLLSKVRRARPGRASSPRSQ